MVQFTLSTSLSRGDGDSPRLRPGWPSWIARDHPDHREEVRDGRGAAMCFLTLAH